MKNLRKLLSVLLSAALLAMMLSACTPAATPQSTEEPKQEENAEAEDTKEAEQGEEASDQPFAGTSVSWSCYQATDQAMANMKELQEEPCLAATGIELKMKVYADRQTLAVEVAGGGGPDIMDLDGPTDVVEYINADQVVDLTDYISKYEWEDKFMDWAIDSCRYNGKIYSLPTCFEGMGIYYNVNVMEEHGWEYPTCLDELVELMDKALEAGLTPLSFGNANYQGAVDWLYSTILSCYCGGTENIKKVLQGEDTLWENEGTRKAMEMLADWYAKGYIDNNSTGITTDDMMTRFADGEALAMIDGTWGAAGLETNYPGTNWTFELMPPEKKGDPAIFPIAVGGSACINKNSANYDAAAAVLQWHFFENADNMYKGVIRDGGQPYPVKWFDADKLEGMNSKLVHMYDVMNEAMQANDIGYCSWTFYPADCRVFMNEKTDAVFLQTMTVQEYLEGAQKYIDEAIANGTAPTVP